MKWYYAEPLELHLSEKEIEKLLLSNKSVDLQNGLYFTVGHDKNYYKSEGLILHFIESDDKIVRRGAIFSISALVRLHKNISLDNFLPLLDDFLDDPDDLNHSEIETALRSIWIFCEGARNFESARTVGRYFNVLRRCEQFEKESKFNDGVSFFQNLKSEERHSVVLCIIDECADYLKTEGKLSF